VVDIRLFTGVPPSFCTFIALPWLLYYLSKAVGASCQQETALDNSKAWHNRVERVSQGLKEGQ